MKSRNTDPDLMSARDVAQLLNLSLHSVYEGAARLEIPHCKVGKRLVFSRKRILAWLHGTAVDSSTCNPALTDEKGDQR